MFTSIRGIKFTACREAFVARPYPDGKHGEASQGFGLQDGKPQIGGPAISLNEGLLALVRAIRERDKSLAAVIKVPLLQHEWDALSSLFYQKGSVVLKGSPEKGLPNIPFLFNTEPSWKAIREFIKFNSGADNIPTRGHTIRRVREMDLGLDGDYGDIWTFPYFEVWRGPMKPVPFPGGEWEMAARAP